MCRLPTTLPGATLTTKPLVTFYPLGSLHNYYYAHIFQKSAFITKPR